MKKLLKQYYGYKDFRPGQKEIIESILNDNDTLAIMPTGGGKSLCYQIPSLIFSGLTVVISPLIALMEDQVKSLDSVGIPSLFLNSSLEWEEYTYNMSQIRSGKIKLLYCAPETLVTERIQNLLAQVEVSCITIDEAHCISEWGHDFRPEYRRISEIRQLFPKAVCLALTATATETVRKDIKKTLKLGQNKDYKEFISSFNRPNIYLDVISKSGSTNSKLNGIKLSRADEITLDFIKSHQKESGIIYCFSRKKVDELTALLQTAGYSALPYHAGLNDTTRSQNQSDFIKDNVKIIVATLAFGMGINKPNVRYVIHYDLPKSIEQYYQEIGRAGRDGLQSTALLLYSYGDTKKLSYFIEEKAEKERKIAEEHLKKMVQYAETTTCKREFLLNHFGESLKKDTNTTEENCCSSCENKDSLLTDVTIPCQKLMSAILRTKEKFGAHYVIDVLLGSKQKKILDYQHDTLSVYGIGTEYSKTDWLNITNLLIAEKYILKSEDYNVLSLTEFAKIALSQRKKIFLPFTPTGKTGKPDSNLLTNLQKKSKVQFSDKEVKLQEALKTLRKKLAEEYNVPPYIIFGDKTLEQLVYEKPLSDFELENVYGLAAKKIERYGEQIIKVIEENI
ncbi:MAG: DNA helicase RecQ [Spirochaetaceae bacterium]|nr:DNA helicase RecQ [Spirochaetaceae bacterium]